MRAAIFVGQDQPLVVEEVTPMAPGPRDAVVRVGASGVCHSDLSIIHGYVPIPPPTILGHEGTGTVEEVGPEVASVKAGDRVVAAFTSTCGSCFWCVNQQTNWKSRRPPGVSLTFGSRW